MSLRDSELDQLLAKWLEDDAFAAPARPVEAAIEFARRQPRRSDWLAFLRRDAMTSRATTGHRPVAVFAIVTVVLLIGAGSMALIGRGPNPIAAPTATPTATSTTPASTPPASQTATPVAVRPLPLSGPVAPGTYRLEFPDSPVTVDLTVDPTVGEYWSANNEFTLEGVSAPWHVQYLWNPPRFYSSIAFYTVGNVNTDGCDWEGTQPDPPIGPTVDDFIAALDAQENTAMSPPVDVVLDGHAGKRVDMRPEGRIGSAACVPQVMWVRPNGEPGHPLLGDGGYSTVWVLDVDGHRVVIDTALSPAYEDNADVQAQVMAVMDSMEFAVD